MSPTCKISLSALLSNSTVVSFEKLFCVSLIMRLFGSWRLPLLEQSFWWEFFDWNVSPFFSVISTTTFLAVSGYYWMKQQRRGSSLASTRTCDVLPRKNLEKRRRATLLMTPLTIKEIAPENRKRNIVVLGLSGAGKTSLLHRILQSGATGNKLIFDKHEPTLGVKMTSVERQGLCNNFYEVGGADRIRAFAKEFLHLANLVIFVLDAASDDIVLESANQYYRLISERSNYLGPILVIANKQDRHDARAVEEIADRLGISEYEDVYILPAISAALYLENEEQRDGLNRRQNFGLIAPKTVDTAHVQTLIENLLYRHFV